jgi:hypothetical protein
MRLKKQNLGKPIEMLNPEHTPDALDFQSG